MRVKTAVDRLSCHLAFEMVYGEALRPMAKRSATKARDLPCQLRGSFKEEPKGPTEVTKQSNPNRCFSVSVHLKPLPLPED